MTSSDTIFARASGAGKAGIAVYRLSGPGAFALAASLIGRSIESGRARLARLSDPHSGEPIDEGLVLAFKAPRSFTGEDVAEFHLHGSRAVEAAIGAALLGAGARLAEAGEFTRRAFLNGRMDLAEVEALADLIDAETALQRRQALGQLGGALSALAQGWKAQLISILAALEAGIDFPDEEGVPEEIAARARPMIEALSAELAAHLGASGGARRLREGVDAAIIGAPNAGKSALMNALAGADLAIVSPIAGTTRDVIEARLDLGGVAVMLADTAGLGDNTGDVVEAEGMRRARARAAGADVRVLVVNPGDRQMATDLRDLLQPGDILLFSKSDLGVDPGRHLGNAPLGVAAFHVSARTGAGMAEFIAALTQRARDLTGAGEGAAFTRLRHVEAGARALAALERARRRIVDPMGGAAELSAEDVRLAARALMSITGAVDVEDVLGEIFESFCIGK